MKNGHGNPATQKQVDGHGPIPQGQYSFNPRAIQSWNNLGVANQIGSTLSPLLRPVRGKGTGGWPGGYNSWGDQRVWLTPDAATRTYGRSGFSIHGGRFPGSAGCIDLVSNVSAFFGAVDRTQPAIPVYVDYP